MTETKLRRLIESGQGSGRDEGYLSWIRIRRRSSSPVSNQHALHVPIYKRALQLLSGLEHKAANFALWIGAREIREQHPAWPHSHPHPAGGVHPDFDRQLGTVPGLQELAKAAGIDHGVYPGTKIPFVATLDFTLGVGPWEQGRLVHWSCKPRSLLETAPNRARMWERIELERRYSEAVGAKHVLIDGAAFEQTLMDNLDWLRPLRTEFQTLAGTSRLADFSGFFLDRAVADSVGAAKAYAGASVGLDRAATEQYFRIAAWLGLIDVDLRQAIVMSRPLVRDHSDFKGRTRFALFGA